MSNFDEARAALAAVKEIRQPAFVSLNIVDDLSNKLRSVEDLREAIDVLYKKILMELCLTVHNMSQLQRLSKLMTELNIPFGSLGNDFKTISPLFQ